MECLSVCHHQAFLSPLQRPAMSGIDRNSLLNWGTNAVGGNNNATNTSINTTNTSSQSGSQNVCGTSGSYSAQDVWGNIGFDARFDNRQTRQQPLRNASALSPPAGALDAALQQTWGDLTRGWYTLAESQSAESSPRHRRTRRKIKKAQRNLKSTIAHHHFSNMLSIMICHNQSIKQMHGLFSTI